MKNWKKMTRKKKQKAKFPVTEEDNLQKITLTRDNEEEEIVQKITLTRDEEEEIENKWQTILTLEQINSNKEGESFKDHQSNKKQFNSEYRNNLNKFIKHLLESLSSCFDIHKNTLEKKALELYDYAVSIKGMSYQDLVRNPSGRYEYLASTLIYYSFLLKNVKLIVKKLVTRTSILESLGKKELSKLMLKPNKTTLFYFFNFLSDKNKNIVIERGFKSQFKTQDKSTKIQKFDKILFDEIDKRIEKFTEYINLKRISIDIYNDIKSEPNSLTYNKLPPKNRNPKDVALSIIFFALKHDDYNIKKFRKYGVIDYINEFFSNRIWALKVYIPFLYNFLSEDMKKKIFYIPIARSATISVIEEYENNLWNYINRIIEFLEINSKDELENIAKGLYNYAKSDKNFNLKILSIKNPLHLAVTLIHLSSIKSNIHNSLSQKNLVKNLRNTSPFSINRAELSKLVKEFHKFVSDKVDLLRVFKDKEIFTEELNRIMLYHEKKRNINNYYLIEFILELYKIIDISPNDFCNFLGLYKSNPSGLLKELEIHDHLLLNRELLFNTVENFRKIISQYVPQEYKDHLRRILSNFTSEKKNYFEKLDLKREEAKRARKAQYGLTYFSTECRIEKFILMLGFSPYDGYDLWENKVFDSSNFKIWADFHHIKYHPKDKSLDDLAFIPRTHPNDLESNQKHYLTHFDITTYEVNNDRIKLKEIKNRTLKNQKIIIRAFFSLKSSILDQLEGWNVSSIKKIKRRLNETAFSWCKGIEKYIPIVEPKKFKFLPKEKYNKIVLLTKRVSNATVMEVINKLNNKRNKTKSVDK